MKKNILSMIIFLIILGIFNVLFYMIGGTNRTLTEWISYIFIHIGYAMLVLTPLFVSKGKSRAVFSMVLGTISYVYFLVNLAVGLFFINHAANAKPVTAAVTHLVILAVYFVILLTNVIANDETAEHEARHQAELQYVKESAASIESIMAMTSDPLVRKKIQRAYDAVASSPAKSNHNVADIEYQVISTIQQLRKDVASGNNEAAGITADSIVQLAGERNRQLRLYQ